MKLRQLRRDDATTGGRPQRSRPIRWIVRSLAVVGVAIGLTAASIGGYAAVIIYQGNFSTVSPGIVYRSAQLSGPELESVARQYGIKSVLNLRGRNVGSPWYDEEVAQSQALGLVHYDYGISALRLVTSRQIADILDILREAPKPLLVHCMSGADRAGLVAALYRYAVAGESAEEADRELSLLYGHFPYLTSRSGAMDDSFWAFVNGTEKSAAR
jgi:protein tyrosine phosphatase (PTP) superfamily phosphohydrolase (DUF442 family)